MKKSMISVTLLIGLAGCNANTARRSADEHQAPATAEVRGPQNLAPGKLSVVRDRNQVCMVNDQYMGREQIPVTVDDKTYYGCCPMCKTRLERDATLRTATDPVSGASVDKATAVIAQAPSGAVLYFENEHTLARYEL